MVVPCGYVEMLRLEHTAEIPAASFVLVVSWDESNQRMTVKQPDKDNLPFDTCLIAPELVAANKSGLGFFEDIHVVKKAAGETPSAGDCVGTKKDSWYAKEICIGMLRVLYVGGDELIVRPIMKHNVL